MTVELLTAQGCSSEGQESGFKAGTAYMKTQDADTRVATAWKNGYRSA